MGRGVGILWHAKLPCCAIVAPKRQLAAPDALEESDFPPDLGPIRLRAPTGPRLHVSHAEPGSRLIIRNPIEAVVDGRDDVVRALCGSEGIVDVPGAVLAPPVALFVGRVVVDKGEEFDVAAVAEDDELVLRFTVSVAAAGRQGEVGGEPGWRVVEVHVGKGEDDVVDLGSHPGLRELLCLIRRMQERVLLRVSSIVWSFDGYMRLVGVIQMDSNSRF